nr:YwiC-like family protein [Anaerolineae bacterium]
MKATVLRRIKLILPSEHGSWSLMLTPFIIGAGIAVVRGGAPGASRGVILCLIAVLAIFFLRQPITLIWRIGRGKARKADLTAAWFWSLVLVGAAALAGAGLLALGRWQVAWLAIPALGVLLLTLLITSVTGPRNLFVELAGVAGLALAAPAAYVSATAELDAPGWLTWGISALHNLTSVLYVRLRIDDRHGRASSRQAWWVVAAHIASFGIISTALWLGWIPWLVAIVVGLLLIRAIVIAWRRPLLDNVRRFGFTEMGLAFAFAAAVILAYAFMR